VYDGWSQLVLQVGLFVLFLILVEGQVNDDGAYENAVRGR